MESHVEVINIQISSSTSNLSNQVSGWNFGGHALTLHSASDGRHTLGNPGLTPCPSSNLRAGDLPDHWFGFDARTAAGLSLTVR